MDGLAISSVSTDALAPIIDRVVEAGIPVITYNTDNPDSKRIASPLIHPVGRCRKPDGEVHPEGKLLILTLDAAAQWSLDRESGAREAMAAAGCPAAEVVHRQYRHRSAGNVCRD